MTLREFLDTLPRGGLAALAAGLDRSTVYLLQLAARQDGREAGPELAVRIEQATAGAVRRWDLRPADWHRIWPELIGAEGAPTIPEEARDAA
jgi:DNA-binding transcriptional regulator YdaS (Cro superfamily)